MAISRFEDLDAWRRARDLCLGVYRVTAKGRFAKDFGLRDQIQRASVSVMSNIAEGFERYSRPEFRHFLAIAKGSSAEVRSQLHIARALEYIDEPTFNELHGLCLEVSRLIGALHASLHRS